MVVVFFLSLLHNQTTYKMHTIFKRNNAMVLKFEVTSVDFKFACQNPIIYLQLQNSHSPACTRENYIGKPAWLVFKK